MSIHSFFKQQEQERMDNIDKPCFDGKIKLSFQWNIRLIKSRLDLL